LWKLKLKRKKGREFMANENGKYTLYGNLYNILYVSITRYNILYIGKDRNNSPFSFATNSLSYLEEIVQ